jgi:hypothetical protein
MQWYSRAVRFGDAVLARDWAGTYEHFHLGMTTMFFIDVRFEASYAIPDDMSRLHVLLATFILVSELFLLGYRRRSTQFDARLNAVYSGSARESCLLFYNAAGKSLLHRCLPVQPAHVDLPGPEGLINQAAVLVRPV